MYTSIRVIIHSTLYEYIIYNVYACMRCGVMMRTKFNLLQAIEFCETNSNINSNNNNRKYNHKYKYKIRTLNVYIVYTMLFSKDI